MRKQVLLADDDPSILKMTKLRLEHAGYEVITASDGEEVLQRVAEHPTIDLVLLDLQMPKLTGLEVCQRLKANPATANLPVIIFTASESFIQKLADLCTELGATDWIAKPFRSQELLEKIQHAIDHHMAEEAHEGAVRVLVVDDDSQVHEFFKHLLPAAHFHVDAVSSGAAALRAVQQTAYTVAVVDIIMPGMDGVETLKRLLAAQPNLKVIMMTSHQVEDLVKLALHFGAVECLHKPFEKTSDLLDTLERFRK
jgi:CheY-like chemotaxis protein